MWNNTSAANGEYFSSVLQSELYDSYVWAYISNTKFEWSFVGNDTVHFPKYTKLTVQPLLSSYDTLTTQDVVIEDETFVLDKRYAASYRIADEDYLEMNLNPDNELIKSFKDAFANVYDKEILGQYVSAGYELADGDMEAASNNWGTNPIIASKTNIYDLVTAINQKFDENSVPVQDRWLVISPKEKRLIAKSPELIRGTQLWDRVVTWGYMWEINGVNIWFSNNLITTGGVKHALAWQGKPICFAANIKPSVTFINSSSLKDEFVNYVKAQTKFWVKTFHEGAIRLMDVNLKS